ncbi:MAG: posphoenolpyruvate synthetase regulatory kinase/phosphorylase PpsR [Acidiferrobacterales bacterium]
METRAIFFVSDRTALTAEGLGNSLLTQFDATAFTRHTMRFIDTPDKARTVSAQIRRAAHETGTRPIIFSTLIDSDLRRIVAESGGVFFDFVDTFIGPLEAELKQRSSQTVGKAHVVVDKSRYNLRMDAVNFALATDDGLTTNSYEQADLIVVGVSRSGKTPTCLYMALTFGIYAANYPLTTEDLGEARIPAGLAHHRRKLFGLTIDPVRLQGIRSERKPDSQYASLKNCQYEVRQAEALFRENDISFLATTAMSVEEIATTIAHRMKLEWRLL